jgi:Tol biopolymer transport system component
LVKSDIGNVGFLGLARNGVLAFNQAVNRRRGYTAQFDPVTGRVSQQLRLSDRAIGPSSPKWSPDGKFLAMTRDRQLVIRTVETGEEREFPMNLITPNALNNNLVPLLSGWFPDGRSVLISGQDTQGKGAFIRYYIDPPQAVVVPVTGTRWIRQSISPDGNTVYTADSNNQSQILAVNVATGATVNVAKAGDGFALSPDGRQFAYITGGQEKDTLYVIGVNGGEPRKVTEFVRPLRARALVWSSDGRHFLVSDRSSAFWVTVDSGTIQNAGITDVGFDMASISPDARHIAFTRGGIGTEAWALENFLPPSSRSR